MAHESEVHTLAVPYALHALPEDEVEQFHIHLEQCESCRDEVDEVRSVAARLGGAETQQPPADLRRRVLDEIAAVRPLPPIVDNTSPKVREATAARRWWPRIATGVAAALLVVVGVLTSVVVDQSQQIDDQDATREAIGRVAAAPDMQQSGVSTGDGQVTVMASRSRDAVVVLAGELAAPPDGKDYQVWFMHDEQVRSAGLLPDGDRDTRPLVADDLDDATKIGITLEPDGGSEQPTSNPLAVVDVPA